MVHSGSASPVKTSASPHLTVPATAPPPLVPPHENTTDQDLNPAKLLATDLTSNSVLTQPSTLTPVEAEPPTSATALATNSSRASAWSSTETPTTTRGQVNGRTSGRKRTPKACDCCGPNSTGHNVRTLGRGRGRARGRGAGRDLRDTPKRKVEGQLTRTKCFDLTTENVEEAEDEEDGYEKGQNTLVVADTPSQTAVAQPVAVSLQDEPIRNSVAPEKRDAQKMEDMSIEGSGGKGGVEMLLGIAGRGAPVFRGRGMVGAMLASHMDVEGGIKKGGLGGVVISSTVDALAPLVFVQRQNKDANMDHGGQTDPGSVKSSRGNGDTVNLSDTEPEDDTKDGNMMVREMANGLLAISQDLDSDMQVDKTPDRTDSTSVPVALSNGNVPTPANTDHCSTLMEVETSHPAVVAPPFQGPITVLSMQYSWALRDHRLYCQPATWVRAGMEEVSDKTNGSELDVERLEQLTEMVHGKRCALSSVEMTHGESLRFLHRN